MMATASAEGMWSREKADGENERRDAGSFWTLIKTSSTTVTQYVMTTRSKEGEQEEARNKTASGEKVKVEAGEG